MTIYHVNKANGNDGGPGTKEAPFKTITRATARVQPGDTVKIKGGVYNEKMVITTPNTTWLPDGDGSDPVIIDGKWGPHLMVRKKMPIPSNANSVEPNEYAGTLDLLADDIVVDGLVQHGFIIRNSACRHIRVFGAKDCVIRNLSTDFGFSSELLIGKGADRTLIEKCTFTRSTFRWGITPGVKRGGAGLTTLYNTGSIVQDCFFGFNAGEGIDIDMGTVSFTFRRNEIMCNGKICIYNIGAIKTRIYENVVWFDHKFRDFGTTDATIVPNAIDIGDEVGRTNQGTGQRTSEDVQIYNNIVIGLGNAFTARGNTRNYIYGCKSFSVTQNTFLAVNPNGSEVGTGYFIDIGKPGTGAEDHRGVIADNVFGILGTDKLPRVAKRAGSKVVYQNNLWYKDPGKDFRGPGDVIGAPRLRDMDFKVPEVNYSIDRIDCPIISIRHLIDFATPRADSPAVNKASSGGIVNGIKLPDVTTDILGNERGARPDLGAIESGAEAPTDPPEGSLTASFRVSLSDSVAPATATFTDTSEGTDLVAGWLYDFDDGESSTDQHPEHVYAEAGVYHPSVTVVDSAGRESFYTHLDGLLVENVATEWPDALRIAYEPGAPGQACEGALTIYSDPVTGRLAVVRPDGATNFLSLDGEWTGGEEPPTPSEQEP